jgi:hypothetical protein
MAFCHGRGVAAHGRPASVKGGWDIPTTTSSHNECTLKEWLMFERIDFSVGIVNADWNISSSFYFPTSNK